MSYIHVLLVLPSMIVCFGYAIAHGNELRKFWGSFLVFFGQITWVAHGPGLSPTARATVSFAIFVLVIVCGSHCLWNANRTSTHKAG